MPDPTILKFDETLTLRHIWQTIILIVISLHHLYCTYIKYIIYKSFLSIARSMLAISTGRVNRARANGETAKRQQSYKRSKQNVSFKYEVYFETENTYFDWFYEGEDSA